ncbi:twin-arginine translocation signal domain-containing protein [Methylophaga lonarensis]|uniref:twin-arginine translocation signal domain-containing protein n=1 Tax=Methylophaga lonarensis TaxID=999151 RepID=UPI003D265012
MTTESSNSRRQFLQKITLAAGAATLAATSGVSQATPATTQTAVDVPEKSKGYQRTEHVDTYYHLADF